MEVNTGFLLSFSLPESDPTKQGWGAQAVLQDLIITDTPSTRALQFG